MVNGGGIMSFKQSPRHLELVSRFENSNHIRSPRNVRFASQNRRTPMDRLYGFGRLGNELGPKRVELLHELAPKATTIAALINPTSPADLSSRADPITRPAGSSPRPRGPAPYPTCQQRTRLRCCICKVGSIASWSPSDFAKRINSLTFPNNMKWQSLPVRPR